MGAYDNNWTSYGSGSAPGTSNFGTPYALDTSYSTYNKPSLLSSGSSSASSSSGGWNASDYLNAAQLILGAINQKDAKARASKPPNFIQVPQTDQEKKLWDLFYAQQTDPATKNNRAIASGYAQDMLANSHPTWDAPKTSTGETGYSGNSGMKWPAVPSFDWSRYSSGPPTGAGTPTPTPTTTTPNPNTSAGGGLGSANSKPDSVMNKSFVNMDDALGGGGGGPRDDQSIYDYLTQNPGGEVGAYLPNSGQGPSQPKGPHTTNGTPITAGMLTPATPDEFAAIDAYAKAHPNEFSSNTAPGASTTSLLQRIQDFASKLGPNAVTMIRNHPNEVATAIGVSTASPILPLIYKAITHFIFKPIPATPATPPPGTPPPTGLEKP